MANFVVVEMKQLCYYIFNYFMPYFLLFAYILLRYFVISNNAIVTRYGAHCIKST